jgi:hypothetical protein
MPDDAKPAAQSHSATPGAPSDVANPLSLSSSVRMQITGCPETPALVETPKQSASPAQWMYQRLAQAIAAFEKNLDAEHEVGFSLVSTGGGQMLHADNIGYWAPDLLLFFGRNEQGLPIQLIQHVTQVNLLLVAAKKQTPEPPKRIGFDILQNVEASKG